MVFATCMGAGESRQRPKWLREAHGSAGGLEHWQGDSPLTIAEEQRGRVLGMYISNTETTWLCTVGVGGFYLKEVQRGRFTLSFIIGRCIGFSFALHDTAWASAGRFGRLGRDRAGWHPEKD
jgi:hypothetical protein